jgi:outer membrane protein assembly factor BamB
MINKLRYRLLCAASLFVIVAGCASNDVEENAPAKLLDFTAERRLDSVWSRSVGNGQGEQDYLRLTPVIAGEKIFAASNDGEVAAFNKTDGDKYWDTEIEDETLVGGVGISGDLVLVTTTSGKLVALDANSGEQRWSVQLPSEALAPATGDGNVIAVHTYNGQVIGFAQADGKKIWSYSNSVPALTLRGSSGPVFYNDLIINSFANGKLTVFDKVTGAMRWEARVGIPEGTTELERLVDVDADPLVDNGVLYAVGYQGRIVAVDPENGRLAWFNNASSNVNMSVSSENIFVAGSKGSVTAFALNGDGVRWEQTALTNRQLSGTAAIGDVVVVGDIEGYLHVMSQEDGHMVARVHADSDGVRAAPIVDGDLLYVFTNSGDLIAYRLADAGSSFNINFHPIDWVKDLF